MTHLKGTDRVKYFNPEVGVNRNLTTSGVGQGVGIPKGCTSNDQKSNLQQPFKQRHLVSGTSPEAWYFIAVVEV